MDKYLFSLYHGRNDYSPAASAMINKYGQYPIINITVGRHPLSTILNSITKFFSNTNEYDKYFHLYLIVTLSSGKKLVIQKEHVIKIEENIPRGPYEEYFQIHMHHNPTLYEFLKNSQSKQKDYFQYRSGYNNCQEYVYNLLIDNFFRDEAANHFILQNVREIFDSNSNLRKFVNTLTDIRGRFDIIEQGGDIRRTKSKIRRVYKKRSFS